MKNFYCRNNELKNKFNIHLQKLTGIEIDFYSTIKNSDVLELKTVLSDINNLLTYKLTLKAGEWIGNYFQLDSNEKDSILERIDAISPNAQGFDIVINEPLKIIAEVKCNVPVKEGFKFGAMQSKKIIEDAQKMLNGKRQLLDTKDYLKFLFVINVGERTENALYTLTNKTKIRVESHERVTRNLIRDKMTILKNEKPENLNTEKVYIKTLELN